MITKRISLCSFPSKQAARYIKITFKNNQFKTPNNRVIFNRVGPTVV